MTLIGDAVEALAQFADEPVEVNEYGNPMDWPYLEGMVDLLCAQVGLTPTIRHRLVISRELMTRVGFETYTSIPVGERVRVCPAEHDARVVMAEFTLDDGRAVCEEHLRWRPPRGLCTCSLLVKADLGPMGVEQRSLAHDPRCPLYGDGSFN